jgi:tetratricopeptide (TPR) repeat protein
MGKYDLAIAECSKAIRLDPLAWEAYLTRATAYRAIKDYERAIADASEAIRQAPTNKWLHYIRGEIYRETGKHDLAIADCTEAIRLDPTLYGAYANRAEACLALENYDQALTDCAELIRLAPADNSCGYQIRAKLYTRLGDNEKAVADARQVIKLTPKNPAGWLTLLDLELARGASVESVQALVAEAETALDGPVALEIVFQQAAWDLWSSRQGDYEETCREIAAQYADSTETTTLYLVARTAAVTKRPVVDTEQLVKMASRVVEGDQSAWYQHTLALCLLRDGRADAAIKRFHQSLEQTWSGAPANWLGLALAHAAAQHDSEAQEWLRKAQDWFRENPLDLTSTLHPHDRIECQLLLREAEERIGPNVSTKDNDTTEMP